MAIPETITALQKILERCENGEEPEIVARGEVVALREAINYLMGFAIRSRALNIALDLCQGRHKSDYEDAFNSNVVVEQARNFENYLAGKEEEE